MIIAVNTRLLLKNKLEGIGWFMHENLRRITPAHPEHTFLFLFDRPFSDEFIYSDNIIPLVVPPPARHPVLWYSWLEFSVSRVIRKQKAGIYLGPDGYMPLGLDLPCHITIHDINFHHRPEDLPPASRYYYRKFFPRFAASAGRIATVSEYSKSDIADSYGTDTGKIDVVYNGVNEIYSPLSGEEIKTRRGSLTGGIPYFVFVGSLHPRKNIPRLLLSFDLFRSRTGKDFKLVIVGEKMFMTGEMKKVLDSMSHSKDIVFTGRMAPTELRTTLGAATALTFVPLFEGFGIPLLEAMSCSIPVLASNRTSLPEIASDAALFVNPEDINEIADGMARLASEPSFCSGLVKAGKLRVKDFSWDKTSGQYWNSVNRLMEEC